MEEFVSSDLVGTALCFGFLAGAFFSAFFIVFLNQVAKRNFKNYYLECNEEKRKELSDALYDLSVKANDLVNSTNVNYFKKMHNSLVELRNYLLRRSLN